MPSRWMAPKLQKMRQPYTDQQRMWLPGLKSPGPDILDRVAEQWMTGGWNCDPGNICPGCGTTRTVRGNCTRGCQPVALPSGEVRMMLPASPLQVADQSRARYQAGARVMREQGLSGRAPKRKRKKTTTYRTVNPRAGR